MADEREPLGGGFGRIDRSIDRLERRIEQSGAAAERQTRRTAGGASSGGRAASATGRRISQDTSELNANTRAQESNRAATERRLAAERSGERRTRGGIVLPTGASSGSVPSATSQAALQTGTRNKEQARRAEEQYTQAQQRSRAIQGESAGIAARENATLQRRIQITGGASQELRKHGALTSEFIGAAAKGNVTLREMGYQVGATIGKFAGWTAAAASVYGVLAGVQKLGAGAIASANGVNQLQRVIDNVPEAEAQAGFRDLSQEFNLPIETVASAQYEMGKVFNDFNTSLAATPALLSAVKVGELSVADASKFLIGTTNAYGLGVADLSILLDQFNALQNRAGVGIRGTAEGTAKAAGSWRAAGGDLNQLVGLIGAVQKVGGYTGQEAGTLFQRAPGLIKRPKNQEILKGLGIDAQAPVGEVFRQAFEKAPGLSGKQRGQLAEGLSTPQLAPRLAGLLGQPGAYEEFQSIVDPANAAGSAAKELDKVLQSISERASRIGTDLEQIGSAFATGGGLVIPGALLVGLDQVLRLGGGVLATFSRLPGPLDQAIFPLLQVVTALRLARRFNLGDSLASRAPDVARVLNQSPDRRARGLVGKGLSDELTFFQDEREQVSRRSAVATRRSSAATASVDAFQIDPATASQADLDRHNALQAESNRKRSIANELADEETVLRSQINDTQARQNRFNRNVVRGRQSALDFAKQEDIYFPPTVGIPSTEPPVKTLPGRRAMQIGPRAQAFEARGRAAIVGQSPVDPFRSQAGVFNALATSDRNVNLARRAALRMNSRLAQSGSLLGRLGSNVVGLGRGMGAFASRLGRSLGPLDKLILGLIAVPIVYDLISSKIDEANREVEALQRPPETPADARALAGRAQDATTRAPSLAEYFKGVQVIIGESIDQAQEMIGIAQHGLPDVPPPPGAPKPGFFRRAADAYHSITDPTGLGGFTAELGVGSKSIFSPYGEAGSEDRVQAGEQAKFQEQQRLREQADAAKRGDRAIPARFLGEIDEQTNKDVDAFKRHKITREQLHERLRDRIEEYRKSLAGRRGDPKAREGEERARRLLAEQGVGPRRNVYAGLDPDKIEERQQAFISQAQSGRAPGRNLRNAELGLRALRRKLNLSKPEDMARYLKARDQVREAAFQIGQEERQSLAGLRVSQTRDDSQKLRIQIEAAGEETRSAVRHFGRNSKEAREAATKQEDLLTQQVEQNISLIESRGRVRAARGGTPAAKARAELNTAVQVLRARRAAGFGEQQVNEAVARVIEAREALSEAVRQEALDLIAARTDYLQSTTTDPLQQARYGLAGARASLSHAKTRVDRLRAMAELNRANQAVREAIRERTEAYFDLLASRTDDPVRLAEIELRKANALARGTTGADRTRAQAEQNRARRGARDAVNEAALDDIRHRRAVGEITADQEIVELQRILRTHRLSKQARNQIEEQIYSLREEANGGDFALDVGNIRLPTIYEIRRAVGGGYQGLGGASSQVQVTNAPQIAINVEHREDATAVGAALDTTLGTSTRAALRSAGV